MWTKEIVVIQEPPNHQLYFNVHETGAGRRGGGWMHTQRPLRKSSANTKLGPHDSTLHSASNTVSIWSAHTRNGKREREREFPLQIKKKDLPKQPSFSSKTHCKKKGPTQRHIQKPTIQVCKHPWHSPWHIKLSKCSKQHVWMERTSLPSQSLPHPQCRCCRCLWTRDGPDSRFQCSWVYTQSGSREPSSQSQPGQRLQICQWQKVQMQTLLWGKVKNSNYSNRLKITLVPERKWREVRDQTPQVLPRKSPCWLQQSPAAKAWHKTTYLTPEGALWKDSETGWKR